MTDAALPSLATIGSDTLESPTRRALRRLFRRKGAAAGARLAREHIEGDGGHQPRNLGLTRKYAISASRFSTMYAVAVKRTTPCTTA
jgi:hypothetical protein